MSIWYNEWLKGFSNNLPLREKCPNTELFLVRIFLFSDWIQENTDQKKLRIWTLFTQCSYKLVSYEKCYIENWKSSNQAENKQICPLVSVSLTNCCFFIAIPIWQSHHFRVCRLLWKCYKSQVLFCGWFLLNLKFLSSCIEKSSVLAYDIISTGTVQFYSTVNDVLNK